MRRKARRRWEVIRTIWPYPDGYGIYNERDGILLDSGLPQEKAEDLCRYTNRVERRVKK